MIILSVNKIREKKEVRINLFSQFKEKFYMHLYFFLFTKNSLYLFIRCNRF